MSITEVDSYTGMVKCDCSDSEVLAMGVREQTQKLCSFFQTLPKVRELKIVYNEKVRLKENQEKLALIVLEPFWELENVLDILVEMPELKDKDIQKRLEAQLEVFGLRQRGKPSLRHRMARFHDGYSPA